MTYDPRNSAAVTTSYRAPVKLVDSISTALPSYIYSVDGVSVSTGDRVLYTNLSSNNNRVYKPTVGSLSGPTLIDTLPYVFSFWFSFDFMSSDIAQSFQVAGTSTVTDAIIHIQANQVSVGTGDFYCKIRSNNGGVPGAVLGTSAAVAASTLTVGADSAVTFTFSTPVSLSSAGTYWVSLSADSTIQSNYPMDTYYVYGAGTGLNRDSWTSTDGGSNWSALSGISAMGFIVNGDKQTLSFTQETDGIGVGLPTVGDEVAVSHGTKYAGTTQIYSTSGWKSSPNAELSNLSALTSINQVLLPATDVTYDAGSTTKKFKDVYVQSIKSSSSADIGSIGFPGLLMYDSSGYASVQWGNRLLSDSAGSASVNWGSRVLSSGGPSKLTWSGNDISFAQPNFSGGGKFSMGIINNVDPAGTAKGQMYVSNSSGKLRYYDGTYWNDINRTIPVTSVTASSRAVASNWPAKVAAANQTWNSICWSPELQLFCAVSSTGTNRAMTSPDGTNWTLQALTTASNWMSICWSPELGLFCAVSASSSTNVVTSPDGKTWTLRTGITGNWNGVAWSPEQGVFCAVGSGATNYVQTSPDGITWTVQTSGVQASTWTSICYSEMHGFVKVGSSGTYRVMTSNNGVSWSPQVAAASNSWKSVCWSRESYLLVAVSSDGTNRVMTCSSPGGSWIARNAASAMTWQSVCWSPELSLFCAVASDSSAANAIMTSVDGITWTYRTNAAVGTMSSVCWSPKNGIFCAIGNTNNVSVSKYIQRFTSDVPVAAYPSYVAKAASYALNISDDVIGVTAAATITLPSAIGIQGKKFTVNNASGGYNVTFATTSSQTIGGWTIGTFVLSNKNEHLTVISDGANWQVVSLNKGVTVQTFVSSSGTYTTPVLAKSLRVQLVGGGGGGSVGGTAQTTAPTNGVATTFGTASAGGGVAGIFDGGGGTGGTSSAGPVIGVALAGGAGGGRIRTFGGTLPTVLGGAGGSSCFGGAGVGSVNGVTAAGAGVTNSGGGGGGGSGTNGVASVVGGSGGGSGGCVIGIITPPLTSYAYAVGGGGSAGSGATSGSAGGAGGSGIIIVEEYYS